MQGLVVLLLLGGAVYGISRLCKKKEKEEEIIIGKKDETEE